jgi:hypothetical protein
MTHAKQEMHEMREKGIHEVYMLSIALTAPCSRRFSVSRFSTLATSSHSSSTWLITSY